MRTNIVLDDELIRTAQSLSLAPTKRALIEEALRTYIRTRTAEESRRTLRERLQRVQSFTAGTKLESAADIVRRDRQRR